MPKAKGQGHHIFIAMQILTWALQRRNPPTRDEIVDRWKVHPGTAWRWKQQLDLLHSLYTISPRKDKSNEDIAPLAAFDVGTSGVFGTVCRTGDADR